MLADPGDVSVRSVDLLCACVCLWIKETTLEPRGHTSV